MQIGCVNEMNNERTDLVVIFRGLRIRMPRDPTRSKCVRRKHPSFPGPMLQVVDVDGLAPSLSLRGHKSVVACF